MKIEIYFAFFLDTLVKHHKIKYLYFKIYLFDVHIKKCQYFSVTSACTYTNQKNNFLPVKE